MKSVYSFTKPSLIKLWIQIRIHYRKNETGVQTLNRVNLNHNILILDIANIDVTDKRQFPGFSTAQSDSKRTGILPVSVNLTNEKALFLFYWIESLKFLNLFLIIWKDLELFAICPSGDVIRTSVLAKKLKRAHIHHAYAKLFYLRKVHLLLYFARIKLQSRATCHYHVLYGD